MALLNIRQAGDELLRKKSRPVADISPKIITLLDDMKETLTGVDGIGLAAPQVGVLRRVVVISHGEMYYELINPEITDRRDVQNKQEACLSVPGKKGLVERPAYIKAKATNRDGEEYEIEGEDIIAIAVCHEIDHLDGILFIDRATELYEIDPEPEDEDDGDEEDY